MEPGFRYRVSGPTLVGVSGPQYVQRVTENAKAGIKTLGA